MNFPDIVSALKEKAEQGRHRSPCYVNRASSLGYFIPELDGCVRRGVYERAAWEQKEAFDGAALLRFREGDRQEEHVLADLAAAGFKVVEQQTPIEWKEKQITGHLDGKLLVDGEAIPLEIKSMSPFIFEMVNCLADMKKKSWLRSYLAQINVYMLLNHIDRAIFLLKDKSSGDIKQLNVELDYELAEWAVRTAEDINTHVAAKTLPDRIENRETCKDCPFKTLCLPDVQFGTPLKIVDDPMFEIRIDHALGMKSLADDYKHEWEVVTDEMKASREGDGTLNIVVGKYRITGKTDAKGTFRNKIEVMQP